LKKKFTKNQVVSLAKKIVILGLLNKFCWYWRGKKCIHVSILKNTKNMLLVKLLASKRDTIQCSEWKIAIRTYICVKHQNEARVRNYVEWAELSPNH